MDKILRGIAKYNLTAKAKFVAEVSKPTQPQALFITCMDSRLFLSEFIKSDVGEIFYIRNAGNMIPHWEDYISGNISTEYGGFELCCLVNKIKNVIVCGHSDCKAVNALYDLRHQCDHKHYHTVSPLRSWITLHGRRTAAKFSELFQDEDAQRLEREPLVYGVNIGTGLIKAVIDPENQFCIQDKFSQINVLEQASHVTSNPYLKPLIKSGDLRLFAMWFDIYTGNVFMFSPAKHRFILLDENGINTLLTEINV